MELADAYVKYLEHVRVDTAGQDNPNEDAWEQFDTLSRSNPRAAWKVLLEIVERCGDDDLSLLGASVLADFVVLHPDFAPQFEESIRTNDRFLKAFQYVAMSGVPLDVQRRMNAAMADRGVDRKFLVEYDEQTADEETD